MQQHPNATAARRPLPGRFAATEPAQTVHTDAGTFHLYVPKPGLVFCECIGHIDDVLARGLRGFGDRVMDRDGRTAFFHDWDACSGYDTSSRSFLTSWSVERRATIRSVVVLTRSKIVSMGVAAANLATSVVGLTMKAHTSRTEFEMRFLADAEASSLS